MSSRLYQTQYQVSLLLTSHHTPTSINFTLLRLFIFLNIIMKSHVGHAVWTSERCYHCESGRTTHYADMASSTHSNNIKNVINIGLCA